MRVLSRTDGPITLDTAYAGPAIHLEHMEGFSIIAGVTGASSLEGTFSIEVSNNAFADNVNNNPNPNAIWVPYADSEQEVDADGNFSWNVSVSYFSSARLVFASTAGTGTATVIIYAKGTQS